MAKELLRCKHGIIKQTCIACADVEDAIVIEEKDFSEVKKNWQSNSYQASSSYNSASGDQDYDIEEKNSDDKSE